jgi:hypothetical protein
MSTPVEKHDALVLAYQILGVDVHASKDAIRHRYLELVRAHHPDKWPHGSLQQELGATRMREINAAYDSIESAPLRDVVLVSEPTAFADAGSTPSVWSRPVSALVETLVEFALAAVLGGVIAFRLYSWGIPVFPIAMSLLLAFGLRSTSIAGRK